MDEYKIEYRDYGKYGTFPYIIWLDEEKPKPKYLKKEKKKPIKREKVQRTTQKKFKHYDYKTVARIYKEINEEK